MEKIGRKKIRIIFLIKKNEIEVPRNSFGKMVRLGRQNRLRLG